MKEQKRTQLELTHVGKTYTIRVDSTKYKEELIVDKLIIGHVCYWLILQNETWRLIGDISLCKALKNKLVRKVCTWHNLSAGSEAHMLSKHDAVRTGNLLNVLHDKLITKN